MHKCWPIYCWEWKTDGLQFSIAARIQIQFSGLFLGELMKAEWYAPAAPKPSLFFFFFSSAGWDYSALTLCMATFLLSVTLVIPPALFLINRAPRLYKLCPCSLRCLGVPSGFCKWTRRIRRSKQWCSIYPIYSLNCWEWYYAPPWQHWSLTETNLYRNFS